jgi:uncharacterized protein (TIGR02678 family)
LRGLWQQPLVTSTSDPELLQLIVRHRPWLTDWLADHPGLKLVVDPRAGFARLHLIPAAARGTHPAEIRGRTFDRRRYVLLCLSLAALARFGRSQTTLGHLAETLEEISRDTPDCEPFDATRAAERRAFVDVLRWLVAHSVLRLRDGDAERYARSREGDALYDVADHLIGQLIACPIPPSHAGTPERLLDEHYPATEEGERLRARHQAVRLVSSEPVVYFDELPSRTADWLEQSRGFVYRLAEEDLGMQVERRREGIAAVDPAGEVTDTRFPDAGSTVKHAALLLAEQLTELWRRGEQEPVRRDWVVERVGSLAASYSTRCGWSKRFDGPAGLVALAEEALALLNAFKLVELTDDGVLPLPAIARFAPAAPVRGD